MNFPAPATTVLLLLACLCVAFAGASVPPESVTLCASCHNQPGNDQVREWLGSPYSQVEGGRGCADCHGHGCSGSDVDGASRPAMGARPGAAARLRVTAVCSDGGVEAEVVVTNLGAGHDLPTGPAGRVLMLEVTALDRAGLPLAGRFESRRPRLAPFEADVSRYQFPSPNRGPTLIRARLVLMPEAGAALEIANGASVCSLSIHEGPTR